MNPEARGTAGRVHVAAALLAAGLVAGLEGTDASTGIRVVSAIVVLLVVLGVLVILARVGLWQQAFVSERAIRILAWVLPVFFLGEAVAAFGRKAFSLGGTDHWELYGPVSLVLGLLALVVAGSGSASPHFHRPHRTMPSH